MRPREAGSGSWGGGASRTPLLLEASLAPRPSKALEVPSLEPGGPSPPQPEPQQPEASAWLSPNIRDRAVSRDQLCSRAAGSTWLSLRSGS